MIREYALNPKAIKSSSEFFALMSQLGPKYGRVLSKYPSNLNTRIKDEISEFVPSGTSSQRVQAYLFSKKYANFFVKRRNCVHIDSRLSWGENTAKEHERLPFDGIINTEDDTVSECLVKTSEIQQSPDECECWKGREYPLLVPRDSKKLAETLRNMLRFTSLIRIVDPFLNAHDATYKRPLKAITEEFLRVSEEKGSLDVEFHTTLQHDQSGEARVGWDYIRDGFEALWNNLPRNLTNNNSFSVYAWKAREGGDSLQERFILTDISGVYIKHDLRDVDPESLKSQEWDLELVSVSALEDQLLNKYSLEFSYPEEEQA